MLTHSSVGGQRGKLLRGENANKTYCIWLSASTACWFTTLRYLVWCARHHVHGTSHNQRATGVSQSHGSGHSHVMLELLSAVGPGSGRRTVGEGLPALTKPKLSHSLRIGVLIFMKFCQQPQRSAASDTLVTDFMVPTLWLKT